MAISRFDVDSAVDRLLFINGQGHMLGLPSRPGTSSTATTGVPTNGIVGFAPGALFINYKSSSAGTRLYTNIGGNGYGTNATALWASIDLAADGGLPTLASETITVGSNTQTVNVTGAQTFLADFTDMIVTGSVTGTASINLDTTANMIAAVPAPVVNQALRLRVINNSSVTLTVYGGDASTVMQGNDTVASKGWHDFDFLLNTLTGSGSITVTSAGGGPAGTY